MSQISPQEADLLADMLNQVCSATLEALQSEDTSQRLALAGSLRQFRGQFEQASLVGGFVDLLVQWLEGRRPTTANVQALNEPFDHALLVMLQEVPDKTPPISHHVLSQLISAVVAAKASGKAKYQRQLAAQLINIHSQLSGEWRERLGPLLENLRQVLGGADPRLLPPVPDAHYQNLWHNTVQLFINSDLNEERAHEQLLERLIHNTIFTMQSGKPELINGFARALLDVQRQAIESNSPQIVTLISAIRAHLQGLDPTPFTVLLEGQELDAWKKILAATRL